MFISDSPRICPLLVLSTYIVKTLSRCGAAQRLQARRLVLGQPGRERRRCRAARAGPAVSARATGEPLDLRPRACARAYGRKACGNRWLAQYRAAARCPTAWAISTDSGDWRQRLRLSHRTRAVLRMIS